MNLFQSFLNNLIAYRQLADVVLVYKDEVGSFNMDDDRLLAIPMMAKGVSMPVPVVLVCKDEFSCFNMDGDCMPAIAMPPRGSPSSSGSAWCTKTTSAP